MKPLPNHDFLSMSLDERRALVKAARQELRQWFSVADEKEAAVLDGRDDSIWVRANAEHHTDMLYERNIVAGIAFSSSRVMLHVMQVPYEGPVRLEAALAWLDLYEKFKWPEEEP